MNEFDELIKADKIKLVKQVEEKSEVQYLGKVLLQRGQKFWELNLSTAKVEEVKINELNLDMNGNTIKKYTINVGCWYEKAINKNNAERKFLLRLKKLKGIK